MSVIVTGAAGHLGRLVTEQLLERLGPEHPILVTRRPEALRESCARAAEVHYSDSGDPASLRDAFTGDPRMLIISTDAVGRRLRQHRAAIDAARAAGVDHVVFTSIVNQWPGNPSARTRGSLAVLKRWSAAAAGVDGAAVRRLRRAAASARGDGGQEPFADT